MDRGGGGAAERGSYRHQFRRIPRLPCAHWRTAARCR